MYCTAQYFTLISSYLCFVSRDLSDIILRTLASHDNLSDPVSSSYTLSIVTDHRSSGIGADDVFVLGMHKSMHRLIIFSRSLKQASLAILKNAWIGHIRELFEL